MLAYEGLSKIYDSDWGTWPGCYVELIEKYHTGSKPVQVCDLACGTGTLARLLADKGYHVHCVDLSEAMLKVAAAKFSEKDPVTLEHADMSTFSSTHQFDIITCTYDSINYLTTPDRIANFFSNVTKSLKPGGRLIFDCNTEYLYLHRHKGTYSREIGGESFVHKCIYNATAKEAITIFEFSSGTETHTQRPYSFSELRAIFQDKGLQLVRVFSGLNEEAYVSECERFVCILEKH